MSRKIGRTILILVATLAFVMSACTPVEPEMSYQGQLTDNGGNPVPDGSYEMTFRLYDASDAEVVDALWEETRSVDVADGLFNVILGQVTDADAGIFAQKLWLGVEVESDGEMTPRQQLTGAPYAMSLAPGAVVQGAVNLDADYPAVLNLQNRGSGAGAAIHHWGEAGLVISGAFDPTSPDPTTTGDYGLKIDAVKHGAIVTATEGIGIRVIGQGTTVGDDDAIRAESVADAVVAISSGTNPGDYGVYGHSEGGRGIYGHTATGSYAGYFDGDVYMQGCTGCTLRYIAANASSRVLEPGDLVTASGVETGLEGLRQPVIQVAPATAGQAVLGVVVGRADLVVNVNEQGVDQGAPGVQFDAVGGDAAPREYLVVVVEGPALVRSDQAEIEAGELLYFGANELTTSATGQTIGMVLGEADTDGMVWVMVGFH